jgi:hypothetical protein
VRPAHGKLQENVNDSQDLRKEQFVTGQLIGNSRRGLDTISLGAYLVADDIVESGSDNNLVKLTAHSARRGDLLRIITSANSIQEFEVEIKEVVDANHIRLGAVLSADLAAGDTVSILRYITPKMDDDGTTFAAFQPTPVNFMQDGVLTEVTEDTVTPANNKALPVKLMGVNGTLNLTANDLDISSSHTEDSIAIGDGTTIMGVTLAGEAKVSDADGLAELQGINSELDTQTTALAAIETAVENVELALNDVASETTLAAVDTKLGTIAGKDFATQTTLAAVLTELQQKADLADTQPVSAASLPLPTGASTSAHQVTQNTALSDINSELDIQTTHLSNIDTDTSNIDLNLGAKADVAVSNPASDASVIAALKGLLTLITSTNTKLDSLNTNSGAQLASYSQSTANGPITLAAPVGAIGMIVQNSLAAAVPIRFTDSLGAPDTTTGFYLGVGQSTSYMPAGDVRFARAETSGSPDVTVLWFV